MLEWSKLKKLQLSRYGEYYSKMEFSRNGFDIYTSEVDDKGIDFIVRKTDDSSSINYYEIQVKTIRWPASKYVFMRKSQFPLSKHNYLSLLIIKDEKITHYLICSDDWKKPKSYPLIDRPNYRKPEWGLNISEKGLRILDSDFRFEKQIAQLK